MRLEKKVLTALIIPVYIQLNSPCDTVIGSCHVNTEQLSVEQFIFLSTFVQIAFVDEIEDFEIEDLAKWPPEERDLVPFPH